MQDADNPENDVWGWSEVGKKKEGRGKKEERDGMHLLKQEQKQKQKHSNCVAGTPGRRKRQVPVTGRVMMR